MSERVLVTGGAGCIGSELCAALLARGQEVIAYDNLSSGKREHIAPLTNNPRFRFVEANVHDPVALDAALDGVSFVHHLAANPDVKFADDEPDRDLRQNTLATAALLDAMRRRGITQLTFSSTSAVYGTSPVQPIPESQPCRPISLYGATKLACEAMISAHTNLFGLRAWVFRFANVVGGRVRKSGKTVVSDFIAKLRANPRRLEILGNGKQAKSYILVGECVDAMFHVVDHAQDSFNLFNLGGDDWLSVTRIAEMVVEELGLNNVEFAYTGTEAGWPGDIPRFRLDVSALSGLGWRVKHTSEEAVRSAIRGILAIS
ncbi:MAG: SDR family NAD(P)-dependent oxidoreductase [Planctomycetes bacterium]|nr:SDR family NAD(P)-dependent oxidoreductase [Planctomycetota bacterium]